ncbi:DUF2637 domain-containing protein [Streptomyces roseochromogenus]|uniref:DUF2637 domain-containing protein n=1 Tax=Streptomyces roseochromogenus subsp. oscitans DS 12.976 TaxID=1352936 RepID=V6KBU1_STRRC|nr:DUF2637 domain-containing protein [Streptomyces roseochromogenus]EST29625.1 hypothetical protein M878_20050 [Streptomyces roseochromogenus subsp. oscitans DS 12.976]
MTSRTATTPSDIPGAKTIRVGIAMLAVFAFVLSYDALRQMAVATHIRGLLTYAFPLVIDGFIGIGIGAQLMLRSAPPRSRRYVGTLVALATGVSIWANALHAVRLNQQTLPVSGLRLGDLTVGALSALAPLALAGAVHLYLVIRRHSAARPQEAVELTTADVADIPTDVARDVADVASGATKVAEVPAPSTTAKAHTPGEVSAERLALARTAPLGRGGRASRRHIESTFRARDLTIGRKEADQLKDIIQAELDDAALVAARLSTAVGEAPTAPTPADLPPRSARLARPLSENLS